MPGTTTSFYVDQQSLKFTILALGNAKVSMKRAGVSAVRAAGQALKARVKSNVQSTAYTMAGLAEKDHPYARRHGTIREVFRKRKYMVDSRHAVHIRSGTMAASLYGAMRGGSTVAYDLGFDLNRAPHIAFVLQGTSKMLPRDPLWQTAQAPATQLEMRQAIILTLGKALRAHAGIRFNP